MAAERSRNLKRIGLQLAFWAVLGILLLTILQNFINISQTNQLSAYDVDGDTITYSVTVEGTQQYYPYHNEDGEWIANKVRGKSFDGHKTFQTIGNWKDATLFGQHKFSAGGKYVTLCEGELDALAAYQMMGSKWPSLSIRNGAASVVKDIEKSFAVD